MGLLLGIDAGNYMGKIAGEHGVTSFRTSICDWFVRDIKETFGDDDMEFEIDGRRGYAGTIAAYEDEFGGGTMYGDSKAHEDTKIRILLAIFQYVEKYCPGNYDITMVTGQPIISHKEEGKQKIIDMVKGIHDIEVNGKKRRIEINNVGIGAEGSSAFWGNVQDGMVRIIDVGSGTVNCATVVNKRHIHNGSGTFNYGTETVSNGGDLESLARGIIRSTTQLKWKQGDRVWLCGGVAEDLLSYIQVQYPNCKLLQPKMTGQDGHVTEVEPVYANAVGFYEIARMVYDG